MSISITDVETYVVRNDFVPFVFVRLETDAGVHGIAEATLRGKSRAVQAAIDEMRDYFIGASPFETELLTLEMYRNELYSMNIVNTTVLSAIDIACWDIKGKLLDRPLYDLLGGQIHGDRLPAYANGWWADAVDADPSDELDRWAVDAEDVIERGYDALKFDPFWDTWQRLDRKTINRGIERIRAVREAVGPDVDLMVDFHARLAPSQAVEIIQKMTEFDITFIEEPSPPDSLDGLRAVSEKSAITVATGEKHITKFQARELLSGTDIGVIQPDLLNAGGITGGKAIAKMAEAKHVAFAPHNPQGPLSTAICAHIDTASPNFMIQETFEEFAHEPWVSDLLTGDPLVANGEIRVPEAPGLGVDLDLNVVESHAYGPDERINPEDRGLRVWSRQT